MGNKSLGKALKAEEVEVSTEFRVKKCFVSGIFFVVKYVRCTIMQVERNFVGNTLKA